MGGWVLMCLVVWCASTQNNPLKNAPHTARVIISDKWDRPYTREEAAYPAPWYVVCC